VARSLLIAVFGLLGLGALAFSVMGALSITAAGPQGPVKVSEVALRPFPGSSPSPLPPNDVPASNDAGTPAPEAADAGAPVPPPKPADAGAAPPPPPPPPAKDAGVPARPPPPPQPVGEGLLNLRASDTADVYVDGKKVGSSPIDGFKVRAGTHKVRFDCYDAAGNTTPGAAKTVTVAPDSEQSVEYECPAVE